MAVNLVFLGRLQDVAGTREKVVGAGLLSDLLAELPDGLICPNVRLALNGTVVAGDGLILSDGDELAFLPPVSGG